ncbi:acyltransferase [Psychrobacter sp. 28M-43]|uniref:acyltransferase n=1 Tax=Psychrobacter sp. 28M-43 TaxID=2772254 RepID=UPI00168CE60C|nr:acyltransferase [Psychrobacter sp. 28M-43]QOD11857.1 acyltransferase [Psychrobacter sp. 28M-43]
MSGPVNLACTDDGIIKIGKNVSFGYNVRIVAQFGEIYIGDDTHIGDGTLIVAKDNIYIGNNVLIAEYVVIRDQDHNIDSDPINSSGFKTAPIHIENNVWLAAKSTVLRGVHVGEGAVVAAHALVNKSVLSRSIVAGVPAKQVAMR